MNIMVYNTAFKYNSVVGCLLTCKTAQDTLLND